MLATKNPGPPETIYLQCYDEHDGSLLDFVRDDVTWCRDRINENDAVYILATPELADLLETLADEIPVLGKPMKWAGRYHCSGSGVVDDARDLATRIKDSLG